MPCVNTTDEAIDMLLWCPECGERHVDEGEFTWKLHHTHACQSCGMVWRPSKVFTRGVRFLPGYGVDVHTHKQVLCVKGA